MINRLLLACTAVALVVLPAAAQEKGQIGLVFKAQLIPQAGLVWHPTSRISLRALVYAEGNHQEVIDLDNATRISMAFLYRFPIDQTLRSYAGADFTLSRFEDENYLGPLFGVEFQPHPRFGVFGEFGFSVDVGDSIQIVSMLNTGSGVVFYLNR